MGFFGNCRDHPETNDGNLRRVADLQKSFTDYVTKVMTNTDENLNFVETVLAALNAIQAEMAATQVKNMVII